jgi:hypothetical protein
MARPCKFDNNTRLKAFPIVVLCPFKKGPIEYLEYNSVVLPVVDFRH